MKFNKNFTITGSGLVLKKPVFYNNKCGIRFGLGEKENSDINRFIECFSNTRRLFELIFQNSNETYILLEIFDRKKTKSANPKGLIELKKMGFVPDKNFKRRTMYHKDEDSYTYRYLFKEQKESPNIDVLFRAILGSDLGIKPTAGVDAYFIDEAGELLFHPYDDRGCDIVSSDEKRIIPIYEKLKKDKQDIQSIGYRNKEYVHGCELCKYLDVDTASEIEYYCPLIDGMICETHCAEMPTHAGNKNYCKETTKAVMDMLAGKNKPITIEEIEEKCRCWKVEKTEKMKKNNKQELLENIKNPKKVEFKIPNGWVNSNFLHEINMSDVVEYIDRGCDKLDLTTYFGEDVLFIGLPEGSHKAGISVDWLPQYDLKGRFVCQIVVESTLQEHAQAIWDYPLEQEEFKTWQEVRDWVNVWIEKLKDMPETTEYGEIMTYLDYKFKRDLNSSIFPIEHDVRIRFGLGGDYKNCRDDRLNQAYERSVTLFEDVFTNSEDELWLFMNEWDTDKHNDYFYKQVDKQNNDFISRTVSQGGYSARLHTQKFIKLKLSQVNYKNILRGIANLEQGREPKVAQRIWFINFKKDMVFYMCNDEECLVYSDDPEKIRHIYEKRKEWIVDDWKKEIDEIFGENN